jgi:hypothetical protein
MALTATGAISGAIGLNTRLPLPLSGVPTITNEARGTVSLADHAAPEFHALVRRLGLAFADNENSENPTAFVSRADLLSLGTWPLLSLTGHSSLVVPLLEQPEMPATGAPAAAPAPSPTLQPLPEGFSEWRSFNAATIVRVPGLGRLATFDAIHRAPGEPAKVTGETLAVVGGSGLFCGATGAGEISGDVLHDPSGADVRGTIWVQPRTALWSLVAPLVNAEPPACYHEPPAGQVVGPPTRPAAPPAPDYATPAS